MSAISTARGSSWLGIVTICDKKVRELEREFRPENHVCLSICPSVSAYENLDLKDYNSNIYYNYTQP